MASEKGGLLRRLATEGLDRVKFNKFKEQDSSKRLAKAAGLDLDDFNKQDDFENTYDRIIAASSAGLDLDVAEAEAPAKIAKGKTDTSKGTILEDLMSEVKEKYGDKADTAIKGANNMEEVSNALSAAIPETLGAEEEIVGEEPSNPQTVIDNSIDDALEASQKPSRVGAPYLGEGGDVKFEMSDAERIAKDDAARQAVGLTLLSASLSTDAKAALAADIGLQTMFGQVFSLSSYMNARELEIEEAGLTGNDKVVAVKAWFNSLPWVEIPGFERTGAIVGSTGFTVLRTVPNITGSKQGLAAMSKMIFPSFPKGYTAKPYSNQMMVQSLDDGFRFRAAISKTGLGDKLGYIKDDKGRFVFPEKPTKEEGQYIRNQMEKIQLTPAEQELNEMMKQIILDAPPAKKYTSKYDRKPKKTKSKSTTSQERRAEMKKLKEEIAALKGEV